MLRKPWVAMVVLAVVTLIIYSNIYHSPFVFDAATQIEDNTKIRDLNRFFSLDQSLAQRPVVEFTFALNYRFGGLRVFGYHLINVLIHITNACLVYFLALSLFGRLIPNGERFDLDTYKPLMALFAALVFVVHPIQTQSVTYTVQRYTSMAALFYFLSILSYMKGRQCFGKQRSLAERGEELPRSNQQSDDRRGKKPKKKLTEETDMLEKKRGTDQPASAFRLSCAGWFGLAFFLGAMAFLCKQNAASLPVVILLTEYMLFDRTWKGWKKKIAWLIPGFLAMALFILYVSGFFKGGFDFGRLLEDVSALSRETAAVTRWQYMCTQFNVICIYIRLLFLPFGQNLDYMYPFKEGFFDGLTPLAFLFLIGIIAIGFWNIKKRPVISFGIFWFFITLSVESSIIPISDALFEHRLYLPMFGFSLVVSYLVFHILTGKGWMTAVVCAAIVGCLGTATYLRNRIWQDPELLWRDVVEKSPHNHRGYNNLGSALNEKGKVREAIDQYAKALSLKPGFALAHNNLGSALLRKGDPDGAISHLSEAVRIRPMLVVAHNNLGVALAIKGKFKEAKGHFLQALRIMPDFAQAYNGLGNVLASQGKINEAIKQWRKALKVQPDYAKPHYNLGSVLMEQGNLSEASDHFSQAVRIKPDYAEAHSRLGIIWMHRGDYNGALKHFSTALKMKPGLREARQGMNDAMRLMRKSSGT